MSMNSRRPRFPSLVLLPLAAVVLSGCAALSSKPQPTRPTVAAAPAPAVDATPVQPPSVAVEPAPAPAAAAPQGVAGELQGLIRTGKVHEMRTVYNGSYGASLLFDASALQYYVALFQQKDFWRVVKTDDVAHAEQVYRNFTAETRQLAQDELRGVRLQAEYAHTEAQLGERAAELTALQQDAQARQQQESVAVQRQQQARDEVERLAQQQREARRQLQELQRQIRQLEAAQADAGARASGRAASRPLPPK